MRYYAGIGSRVTPASILADMQQIAQHLSNNRFILRSGGALGADAAFELGSNGAKEIFIPWFSYSKSGNVIPESREAETIAARNHPNWAACKPAVRKLLIRNVFILLGMDLRMPVEFIICWTPNGDVTGGTGHSLRVAHERAIPIFNIALEDHYRDLVQNLKGL